MPKALLDILRSRYAILSGGVLSAIIVIAALFGLWKRMGLSRGYLLLALGGLLLASLLILGVFAAWKYLGRRRGARMEDALDREPGDRRQKQEQAKIAIGD